MSDKGFRFALLALVLLVALGSVLDVMEVDAAQYASMAQDMLSSDNWLQLYHRGEDYLDKPPLLFWLSALSFKVFGIHNWSYKLPSILFAFLGLYSTYRFTLLHYGRDVARTAVLMFGSSAAFLLMTNDVRCDTILTGSVITAIWLGSAWMAERKAWQLVGCSVAIAAGMLAKGPMGAVAPLIALGADVIMKKRWDVLRDARLVFVPLIVGVLLVPMCIGLYEQHGLHGIRFYFWEQSFGRITGENRWKDDSSFLFFTHELLWELLPWTLFVLIGLWRSLVAVFKRRPLPEYATITGAVLVFIALSLSHFKLPHYLYVIVPLFAVIAAQAMHAVYTTALRVAHIVLVLLLAIIAALLAGWAFPEGGVPYVALLIGATTGAAVVHLRAPSRGTLFGFSFWAMMFISVLVNGHIYPYILRYQANAQAGKWAAAQGLPPGKFYGMQVAGTALDFYAGYPVRWLSDVGEARPVIAPGVVIYTDAAHYDDLRAAGLIPRSVIDLENYEVQLLGSDFVLPEGRPKSITPRYLLRY
ncbi:MAG: glycosyltransferase family 39 protein [Flavobacteriales bacterium]|nr:glycosyltransferase family 39 protein [Flavobacteriales bacterium]